MKHTILIASCLLSGVALSATVLTSATSSSTASVTNSYDTNTNEPTQIELLAELTSIGYIPEYLCAAGMSNSDSSTLLSAATEVLSENWQSMTAARETVTAASRDIKRLSRAIEQGNTTPEVEAQLQNRLNEHTAAQAQIDLVLNLVRTEVNATLSSSQSSALAQIIANKEQPLPTHYLVLDKSPSEWAAFCKAYAECQTNPSPSQDALNIVAAADMMYAVSLAQTHINTHLNSVLQVFDTYITQP